MDKYITEAGSLVVVTEDKRVFMKDQRRDNGSNMNCNKTQGGKWKQLAGYTFKYLSLDEWLAQKGAKPASFRCNIK